MSEGPIRVDDAGHAACIPEAERLEADAASAEFIASHPGLFRNFRGAPPLYRFFPQGGTEYRDLLSSNFVDHDPGAGFRDWNCTSITYDGHRGCDMRIRSFSEQAIGVPVFAVADGIVTAAVDGNPDMNTEWKGQPANYVIINHGGVRETRYWHLKAGSVTVAAGDAVIAGEQIGLTGSSGNSTWPHLHFESRDLPAGSVLDPWLGPCNPGVGGWVDQPPINLNTYISDFGVSRINLSNVPWLPFEQPRTGQLALTDRPHYLWMLIANLPANSTRYFRFIRPNGSVAFQSANNVFPSNSEFERRYSARYSWNITDMGTFAGTWRIQMLINGVIQVDAPVEVVGAIDPQFNRAPAPISLALDPPAPDPEDVLFCRVSAELASDDPDFDVVRFQYLWTIDGVPVRAITSAGHADAVPRNTAARGQTVLCKVTPSDGRIAGQSVSISFDFAAPPCAGDANGDGHVNFSDVVAVLRAWGTPGPSGDVDHNGVVELADIMEIFRFFGSQCAG